MTSLESYRQRWRLAPPGRSWRSEIPHLAIRLNRALREQGVNVRTPDRNESAIVAFEHGISPSRAKQALADADIQVSFREGDSQIRVGVALFNYDEGVDRLLDVTHDWI